MTRPYEVVYIFDSALEEGQINEKLEGFHALLATPNAPSPVTAASHWGKRTLAYPIKKRAVGYYVVVQFETEPTQLAEFERLLKLEDALLRHLIVVNDGLQPQPAGVSAEQTDSDSDEDNEEDDE